MSFDSHVAIVSGANGFVGRALCCELVECGYSVTGIVNSHKDTRLLRSLGVDLTTYEDLPVNTLKDKVKGGIFFHLAWQGSSGPGRKDQDLQLRQIALTINSLRLSKQLGCARFIGAGSITEFEAFETVYKESEAPDPSWSYGIAKLASHLFSMTEGPHLGLDVLWTQITNAYGPGESSPRIINTTLRNCIRGISPRFTSATQLYDFIYIDDVAHAYRLIGEYGRPFQTYVIGSGHPRPLREYLHILNAVANPQLRFQYGALPFNGIGLPESAFDISNLNRDTGFSPTVPFEEGCRKTLAWIASKETQHG